MDSAGLLDCKHGPSFVPLGFNHFWVMGYQGIVIYSKSNDAFLTFTPASWSWSFSGISRPRGMRRPAGLVNTIGIRPPNQAPSSVAQGGVLSSKMEV
jgi:hypothetical protein